jgi:tRNA A-37 threonylcarbamoyl transferase component Bud32
VQERDGRTRFACEPAEREALAQLGFSLHGKPCYRDSGLMGRAPLLALDEQRLVRRFRHGGLLRRVRGERYFDPERPFREAALAEQLQRLGVPTAPVLAARAQALRLGGWRLELVVRRIPEARDLGALMAAARLRGERLPSSLLRAVGSMVRRMHDLGFLHADLQPNNLLVVGEPSAAQLVVLDLDGSAFYSALNVEQRAANVARFTRFILRREARDGTSLTRADWQRMLAAYEPDGRLRAALRPLVRSHLRRTQWWHRLGWALESMRGEKRR